MPAIKILSESIISKIAAGEVVEKPASVVKELLDNAYDANALNITVDIEDAGEKKILIVDDGIGMDSTDAQNAFKLHATSKLATEEDLLNIHQFGFRGEALASIAGVSKVTLKTRRNHDALGTKVYIEGGNVISVEEIGCAAGTSILIEDLFFNVPARKQFLKQAQSEYRAILEVINAHAMANPHVGLQFINNGKTIYSLPKDDQLEDRIKEVIGKDIYDQTVGLFYEHPHLEIYGVAGKPQIATERVKNQYIYVNKRRIFDKTISAAIRDAFQTLIPKNFYPQFVIFIDIPANILDVNVHPRKEEVRFSNSQMIFLGIKECIKKAIERNNLTPGAENAPPMPNKFGDPFGENFGPPGLGQPPRTSPFAKPPIGGELSRPNPFDIGTSPFDRKPPQAPFNFDKKAAPIVSDPFGGKSIFGDQTKRQSPFQTNSRNPFSFDNDDDLFGDSDFENNNLKTESTNSSLHANAKKFLQVNNLYIITEGSNGLVVYDQHAVHERINYEKLLAIYEKGKTSGNTQKMLVPLILNFSAKDYSILMENLDELSKTGFEIEDFGGNSIKITEIPQIFINADLKNLITELIGDLESDTKIKDVDSNSHKALTYLACRSSIKANDPLDPLEISHLISKLETTEIQYTCPHGRPVKIEFTFNELEKLFKRTGF
jgi:DNA mismatch repair protein MutL